MKKVIKKEVIKLLYIGVIYLIFDSDWVSPMHVVSNKTGMTIIKNNKNNELILTRMVAQILNVHWLQKTK